MSNYHPPTAPQKIRFDYIDPCTDMLYRGEASIFEAREDNDNLLRTVTLEEVWELGIDQPKEVFPLMPGFNSNLRANLEQAALEAAMGPTRNIMLPSDWETITVESMSLIYTIVSKRELPVLRDEKECRAAGLRTIDQILPIWSHKYMVTARGGIDDVLTDLRTANFN